MTSLTDGTLKTRDDFEKKLQKEQLFFTSLINASDFLTKSYRSLLERVEEYQATELIEK